MNNAERIRALVGNVKNWSWDIFPQFKMEKEDAEALQDIDALKEFIAEREKYGHKGIDKTSDCRSKGAGE